MIGYALEEKVRQLKKDFSAHFRKITFAAFALGMIILLMGGQSQTPYNFLLIFLGFAILLATTFVIYYMAVLRLWYVMACLSKPFSPRRFTQAIKTATRTTGHNYDISLAIWTLEAWAFGAPPIKIDPPWQDAFLRAYLA